MDAETGSQSLLAVGFSRYRGFVDEQRLELKPITLLFGHNSVGKSAALRVLPILAAAAVDRQSSATVVLDYTAPALRGASFADLISDGQIAAGLRFILEWPGVKYDITLRNLGDEGEVIGSFEVRIDDKFFEGGPAPDGGGVSGPNRYRLFDVSQRSMENTSRWKIDGMRPVEAHDSTGSMAVRRVADLLQEFARSVNWLGAVRAAVPRFFELPLGSEGWIAPDGSGVAKALRLSHIAGDGVSEAVSDWLERTCNCSLGFAATDKVTGFNQELYPFNVKTGSGARIAVKDVGEGVAQALPVITLCHQARIGKLGPNAILAFEQPELHLHPAAAVELANEVVRCVSDGSQAKHVIETHSESMLLAVQIAIVEQRIKASDVVVYWVSGSEAGTSLRPISFDDEGFPHGGWPQGVFREALEQARRLSELRIQAIKR